MKIYIGADHGGLEYKRLLADFLHHSGHEVIDAVIQPDTTDDYPTFAGTVCHGILSDDDHHARGVLICGGGQGMAMAANRFKGIRAALCWNLAEARTARNDDDSNVLVLPSKQLDIETCKAIMSAWLETPFAGADRYVRRIKELDQLS
jgi:ribose 5-phosphate isomerase B